MSSVFLDMGFAHKRALDIVMIFSLQDFCASCLIHQGVNSDLMTRLQLVH